MVIRLEQQTTSKTTSGRKDAMQNGHADPGPGNVILGQAQHRMGFVAIRDKKEQKNKGPQAGITTFPAVTRARFSTGEAVSKPVEATTGSSASPHDKMEDMPEREQDSLSEAVKQRLTVIQGGKRASRDEPNEEESSDYAVDAREGTIVLDNWGAEEDSFAGEPMGVINYTDSEKSFGANHQFASYTPRNQARSRSGGSSRRQFIQRRVGAGKTERRSGKQDKAQRVVQRHQAEKARTQEKAPQFSPAEPIFLTYEQLLQETIKKGAFVFEAYDKAAAALKKQAQLAGFRGAKEIEKMSLPELFTSTQQTAEGALHAAVLVARQNQLDSLQQLKDFYDKKVAKLARRTWAAGAGVVIGDGLRKGKIGIPAALAILNVAGLLLAACGPVVPDHDAPQPTDSSPEGTPTSPVIVTPTAVVEGFADSPIMACPDPAVSQEQIVTDPDGYLLTSITQAEDGRLHFDAPKDTGRQILTTLRVLIESGNFSSDDSFICLPDDFGGVSRAVVHATPTPGGRLDTELMVVTANDQLISTNSPDLKINGTEALAFTTGSEADAQTLVVYAQANTEQILGILDPATGELFKDQQMIDRFTDSLADPSRFLFHLKNNLEAQVLDLGLSLQATSFAFVPDVLADGRKIFNLGLIDSSGEVKALMGENGQLVKVEPISTPTDKPTLEPTPTSTPTPTDKPTLEPTPTDKPTLEPTPTDKPTLEPTPTDKPTAEPTPKPTETPPPSFEWKANFESGDLMKGFSRSDVFPETEMSLVNDPGNSGRGKVLKAVVKYKVEEPNDPVGDNRHRAYPHVDIPFQKGPYSAGVDVLISSNHSPKISSPPDNQWDWSKIPWVSVFSMFNEGPPKYEFAQTVNLHRVGDKLYLRLFIKDTGWGKVVKGAPEFTFDQWHQIRVDVNEKGEIKLFQDEKLVSTGKVKAGNRIGTGGGHAGIYTGGMVDKLTVFNDNMWFASFGDN